MMSGIGLGTEYELIAHAREERVLEVSDGMFNEHWSRRIRPAIVQTHMPRLENGVETFSMESRVGPVHGWDVNR